MTETISIHPPREGWDPAGGSHPAKTSISIHPPREGWDRRRGGTPMNTKNFNPPTP